MYEQKRKLEIKMTGNRTRLGWNRQSIHPSANIIEIGTGCVKHETEGGVERQIDGRIVGTRRKRKRTAQMSHTYGEIIQRLFKFVTGPREMCRKISISSCPNVSTACAENEKFDARRMHSSRVKGDEFRSFSAHFPETESFIISNASETSRVRSMERVNIRDRMASNRTTCFN